MSLQNSLKNPVPLTLERVSFVRPSGNDTALVWDHIDRADQPAIAGRIQALFPTIEQVMFVEVKADGTVHGQMAGGEFCGNALRSLAFMLATQANELVTLSASGTNHPVSVQIEDRQSAALFGTTSFNISQLNDSEDLVMIDGICFIIQKSSNGAIHAVDDTKSLLAKYDLLDYPASGIVSIVGDNVYPFVYVRDTGTVYAETACGSGSLCAALSQANQDGTKQIRLKYLQPSGFYLTVDAVLNERTEANYKIKGKVEVLFDDCLTI